MHSVLTITLNPAVDLDSSVDRVTPGPKLRCTAPMLDPGGGGINISRALAALGGGSTALIAAGGPMGDVLRDLLRRENLTAEFIEAPGDTRQSLSVIDRSSGDQFRFVFPGPVWDASAVAEANKLIAKAIPPDSMVILSGSQPQGFPDDFAADLVALATVKNARVMLDTSGAALRALTTGAIMGLSVLRLDRGEAEDIAGHTLPTPVASADLAADLVARGVAKAVILARGPEGSVLVNEAGRWFCKAAKVPVRSKTGAGDSFVAGFALSLSRGDAMDQALQRGVAAASAAVMTDATALCQRDDAEALIADCPVAAV